MRPLVVVDSRRLLRAVAIGFLVFLFVGGGVGFVVAAGHRADDAATLTVPAPRPGDRAVYAVEESIVDPSLAKPLSYSITEATYEWLPERWDVDTNFHQRLVHPLRFTLLWAEGTSSEHIYVREATYDAATGEPVAATEVWDGQTSSDSELLDRVYLTPADPGRDRSTRFDDYQGQLGPCGMSVPFAGRPYDGSDQMVHGYCDWPGGRATSTFYGQGWTDQPHGHVFRFGLREDTRFGYDYDEASPFPVWLTDVMADGLTAEYTLGRYFVLTRVSSEQGDGSYTRLDASAVQPAEPVRLVPRTPWGLDDSEVADHFTLARAYEAVMAETRLPTQGGQTVPQWLADHPDAYLTHGSTAEFHDRSGQPVTTWQLLWTDGEAKFGKRVTYGPNGQETTYLPAATGESARISDYDGGDFPYPDHGLVPPGRVPAALPKVSDLLAQYAKLTGDAGASGYGFGILCVDDGCREVFVAVTAGRNEQDLEGSFSGPVDRLVKPYASKYDALQADDQGRMRLRWMDVESQEAVFPVLPPSTQPAQEQPLASADVMGVWSFPAAPATAAGVGLLAALAAAMYYFWPALKGGPLLGLFSRIRDERVLDHPQRSRMMDAIRADPGVHFQELSRRLALGHGVLDHHLRKLVDAELVLVRRSPGYTCYFPKATDRRVMDAAPVLRSGGSRAVLGAVANRPGASSRDLAVHLGLAPSTVSYHLKRLETAGLVLPDPRVGVRLTPLGEQAKAAA